MINSPLRMCKSWLNVVSVVVEVVPKKHGYTLILVVELFLIWTLGERLNGVGQFVPCGFQFAIKLGAFFGE